MQTDSYAQGVPYPLLTDKPNAQTLGQGIVEGVVPLSVMRFASRSERGAVITSPQAGMTTWVKDLGLLEVFDGETWTTVAAGQSVWTDFPLAAPWQTWASDGRNNNQGLFQYRVVNLFGARTLMFRGGIGLEDYPSNVPGRFTLTASLLPEEVRPAVLRTFLVPCSDAQSDRLALKVDLRPDGDVIILGTSSQAQPPWVSFNGVFVSL